MSWNSSFTAWARDRRWRESRICVGLQPASLGSKVQRDDGSTQAGQHSLAAGKSLTTVLAVVSIKTLEFRRH